MFIVRKVVLTVASAVILAAANEMIRWLEDRLESKDKRKGK